MDTEILEYHPDNLAPDPGVNPRRRFDEQKHKDLVASIVEDGVLQPILVRPNPDDGPDFIIVGARRWRAAKEAGATVPAVMREMTRAKALKIALIENLQREQLSPIEEAEGYRQCLDEDGELTEKQLAADVGYSQAHVSNRLRLLQLPEDVRTLVDDGVVAPSYARDMLLPWAKEDAAERFFRVFVLHVRFNADADANAPVSKSWLEAVVERIGNVVKPKPEPNPEPKKKSKGSRSTAQDKDPQPTSTKAEPAAEKEVTDPEPEEPEIEAAPEASAEPAEPEEDADAPDPGVSAEPDPHPEPEPAPAAPVGAGLVGSLAPILATYNVQVGVGRKGEQITVTLAPRHAKKNTRVAPRMITAAAEDIDDRAVEAAQALVAELTE